MPRRSNLFQDVVAIIHAHMAADATVEASAPLKNRLTGEGREVDVVVRSEAAGHGVTVAVEASSTGRRASVEWVERMFAKHADLPTDKLVLVSESGFTAQARTYADAKGIVAISPEDLRGSDPAFKVVNSLRSIWPKVVSITPKGVRITVRRPRDDDVVWFKALPDPIVYLDDEDEMGTLIDVMQAFIRANMPTIVDQIDLANIADDLTSEFVLQVGPPWIIHVASAERRLCVRDETGDKPELHTIETMEVRGTAVIHVSEVSLAHRRLGEVMYAYGEGVVGGKRALLLFTEDEQGGKGTLRFRDDV